MGARCLVAACLMLVVAGTVGEAEAAESKGRLIAGVSFDIPGMGYKNPKTGAIEGFEPDVARAVAEKLLGARDRVDFVRVLDDERIKALQDGTVEIVVSQLTITPEREKQVDFSIPYYVTGEGLLVPTGSEIKRFEDLAGKRIAATAGSLSLKRMTAALPSLPGATLVITPTSSETVQAVANGQADAASNDLIDLAFLRSASSNPARFKLVDIAAKFQPKPFGIAVKKGNRTLVVRLNEAINSLKSNGDIKRLLDEAVASVGPQKAHPN
jgi:ABC-type amino acid transport substrate-binding protein